ncbi:MAG: N-acetylmuramoyl-L-alanine amidase [Gemmatimonadetes bacterium]|nr:N-acetylmuramoyl-L-alanine amidase [Gemmatimonadota bacterium]
MADPKTYHFKLPPYLGAPLAEPPHAWYPGVQAVQAATTSDRNAHGDGEVRAFVIHATDGVSSSGAMSVMFGGQGSWHWLIPDENEPEHKQKIWACAPEKRAAWHVRNSKSHPDVNGGKRYVNYWSLGVEIVNTMDADPFSDWQVQMTADLVRYAWSKYPNLVDVVSHAKLDPQRRSDPGRDFPWEKFQNLVLAPLPQPPLVPVAAAGLLRIVGPDGEEIDCDPHFDDGVTVAHARPLVEALGFTVHYEDGPPKTMRIARGGG